MSGFLFAGVLGTTACGGRSGVIVEFVSIVSMNGGGDDGTSSIGSGSWYSVQFLGLLRMVSAISSSGCVSSLSMSGET